MILCDGNWWAWKSYHAAPELRTKDGRYSGLLHIGLTMLSNMPDLFNPDRVLFLWDDPKGSWRKKIYPEYKGNRGTDPDHERSVKVYPQIEEFKRILLLVGISHIQVPTLEADDLAGILTEDLNSQDEKVVLLSSDKDWLQLLRSNVIQIRGWKDRKLDLWTHDRLLEEYKIPPRMWPAYLALVGDKVDNIPNIRRGVGPKMALKIMGSSMYDPRWNITLEERKIFERNLKITRVLTKGFDVKVPEQIERQDLQWRDFSRIIWDYELREVFYERSNIWKVGGWI